MKTAHRTFFYCLLLLLPTQLTKHFFIPSSFVAGIRIDYLAPTIYFTDFLVLGVIACWAAEYLLKNRPVIGLNTPVIISGIVLILFAAGNIYGALSPVTAFYKWATVAEAGLIAFYVAYARPPLFQSSFFLLVSGLYSCALAWGQWIMQASLHPSFYWIGERAFTVMTPGIARTSVDGQLYVRPYATFPHPNVLAGYLLSLLPITLYWFHAKKRFFRNLWLPVYISFIGTIVITFSQSAWVMASIFSLFLVSLVKKWKWGKVLSGVAVLLLLFWVTNKDIPLVEEDSYRLRAKLASIATDIIRDYPFTGVGLNNFIIALPQYGEITTYQDLQPVHTIYLLLLAESGVIGLCLFLGFLIHLFRHLTTAVFEKSILLFSLSALLLLGLIDHYLFTNHQVLMLAAILSGFAYQKQARDTML